jgi:nitronate monooxygenase
MGPEKTSDIIAFLDLMLECERAGAKSLRRFEHMTPPDEVAKALPRLFADEARYCAGLSQQIVRLGGQPGGRTGDFLEKILAADDWQARFDLLVRGQRWVARRIEEKIPEIDDPELKAFLSEMHGTHLANVAEAQSIADALANANLP